MTRQELPGGRHRAPQGGRRKAEPQRRHRGARARGSRGFAIATGAAGLTVAVALVTVTTAPYVDGERASAAVGQPVAGTPSDSTDARRPVRSRTQAKVQRGQLLVPAPQQHVVPLPADSGTGRRVVFSETEQRVWLVEDGERVVRTYLVSGSVYDNLEPGTYEVFSRSRYATGIDDSGTMEYFVRFTYGDEGAAIGFHDIPVADGLEVQTVDQLGTPLSHGCVRQAEPDAVALWEFAPLGTTVVVTA